MTAGWTEKDTGRALQTRLLLVSALVGAAAAYILFVAFLQTASVSLVRLLLAVILFLAISVLPYLFGVKRLVRKFGDAGTHAFRVIACGLVLTGIFLPLLYSAPAYPLSPLLRPWADVAVQFEVSPGSQPLLLRPQDLRLIMGREVLDARSFNLVGSWEKTASDFQLAPGATGSLQWTGTVPPTVTLSLQPPPVDGTLTIYWNNIRTSARVHGDNPQALLIVEKSPIPWGYNLALFLSCFVLLAWAVTLLGVFLGTHLRLLSRIASHKAFPWAIVLLSVALAALTVGLQIDSLSGGMQYVRTTQLVRHAAVLAGHAPNPWQYRVLSEWIAELLIRVAGLLGVANPVDLAFVSLRVFQNIGIFLLAFVLYKRVSHSRLLGLLGILVLAASMRNAYFDNDLAFNTYFDVLFYLLCGLLLLSRRYYAAVILMFFAALNRETSGIIPFLMAAAIVEEEHRPGLGRFMPVLLAAGLFAGVFVGLRWLFPGNALYIPYKHPPGLPLLLYNVTRQFTWDQLWKTLGLVPLLGLAFIPSWPRLWQRFFLILCPIWFAVHAFASVMAETRLFLVPQALVFIPGVLFVLNSFEDSKEILSSQFIRSDSENHEP